jgi:hypothetical protein
MELIPSCCACTGWSRCADEAFSPCSRQRTDPVPETNIG